MLNLSNCLSLSRGGFALLFLIENIYIRVCAVFLAMISDFLDGYLARKSHTTTHFGAILDPIMDKFFVFFVGGVLYLEGSLNGWELAALLSRDISICFFGLYLIMVRGWRGYEVKAIWWGKITTAAQFFLLIALSLSFQLPGYIYYIFVAMAGFAFIELVARYRKSVRYGPDQDDQDIPG